MSSAHANASTPSPSLALPTPSVVSTKPSALKRNYATMSDSTSDKENVGSNTNTPAIDPVLRERPIKRPRIPALPTTRVLRPRTKDAAPPLAPPKPKARTSTASTPPKPKICASMSSGAAKPRLRTSTPSSESSSTQPDVSTIRARPASRMDEMNGIIILMSSRNRNRPSEACSIMRRHATLFDIAGSVEEFAEMAPALCPSRTHLQAPCRYCNVFINGTESVDTTPEVPVGPGFYRRGVKVADSLSPPPRTPRG